MTVSRRWKTVGYYCAVCEISNVSSCGKMGWFRIHKIYNALNMWEQFWGFRLDSIKWGDLYWHLYWSTGGTPRLMSNGGWFHPQLRALKAYVNRFQGHGIEMIYTTTDIRGSHRTALLISWLLTHPFCLSTPLPVCDIVCIFGKNTIILLKARIASSKIKGQKLRLG